MYQILKSVFHHVLKHRGESWKYDVQRSIFSEPQGVWKCGQHSETLFASLLRQFSVALHHNTKLTQNWWNLTSLIIATSFCLDRCVMPLGMEDYRILSGHLRASSSYNYNHGPDRARLNIFNSHGRTGAWVARHRNTHQYLQIDLMQLSIIKGIATQGRREAHQWVKSYSLSFSRFGVRFKAYVSYGRVKVMAKCCFLLILFI